MQIFVQKKRFLSKSILIDPHFDKKLSFSVQIYTFSPTFGQKTEFSYSLISAIFFLQRLHNAQVEHRQSTDSQPTVNANVTLLSGYYHSSANAA